MKKYCKSKSDIPKSPHWAIVYFQTYYIPGDERSKSCPGHGYPESTGTSANYIAFDNEQEWKDEIAHRLHPQYGSPETDFFPMKVTPATVSTEIVVKVT